MKEELWNIKKTGIQRGLGTKIETKKIRNVRKSLRNVRESIRNIGKSIIILRESIRNTEEDGRCWKNKEKSKKMGNFD